MFQFTSDDKTFVSATKPFEWSASRDCHMWERKRWGIQSFFERDGVFASVGFGERSDATSIHKHERTDTVIVVTAGGLLFEEFPYASDGDGSIVFGRWYNGGDVIRIPSDTVHRLIFYPPHATSFVEFYFPIDGSKPDGKDIVRIDE